MYPSKHRFLLLLSLIAWLGLSAQTQLTMPSNAFGDGDNLVTYNFGYGHSMLHEVKVDHFVHDRVSLIYSMRISRPTISQNVTDAEFTAPLGATVGVGVGLVMVSGSACGYMDPDMFFGAFMYSCMIPDGVAMHFYPRKNFDVSPYLNVTGLTFATRDDVTKFYYTPSAGIRLLYTPTDHIVLSVEQQMLVRPEQIIASNMAVGFGIRF
jgi:hypothetical protein